MKKMGQLFLLITLLLPNVAYSDAVELGHKAFERGNFEQAARHWEAALAQFAPFKSQTTQYIDTAVFLAAAYQALGSSYQAKDILQKAHARVQSINDPVRHANVLSQLGDCIATGGDVRRADDDNICRVKDSSRWEKAQTYLDKAEAKAREANDALLLANILNKQGNLWMMREDIKNALKQVRKKHYQRCIEHTTQGQSTGKGRNQASSKRTFTDDEEKCLDTVKAQESYSQCFEWGEPTRDNILTGRALQCLATAEGIKKYQQSLHKQAGNKALTAKASLNLAQALLNLAAQAVTKNALNRQKAESAIQTAHKHVEDMPDSHDKAFALIEVAQLKRELHNLPAIPIGSNSSAVSRRNQTENIESNQDEPDRGPLQGGIFAREIPEEQGRGPSQGGGIFAREIPIDPPSRLNQNLRPNQEVPGRSSSQGVGGILAGPNDTNLDILRHGPSQWNGGGIWAEEIFIESPPQQVHQEPSDSAKQTQFRRQNYNILAQALKIAQTLQDNRAIAYAKGYIAQLYADAKRYDEAIRLTQQAIFYAQSKQDYPELLYRWEWQLGRLLKTQKRFDSATKAYKRAVYYFKSTRSGLQHGYSSISQYSRDFRESKGLLSEGPLNFELTDLLLQQTSKATANEKQSLLKDAINHIESFKGVELRYYFQDECVTEKVADFDDDELQPGTAVFYPIILADRIELLLSPGNKSIKQFTKKFTKNINRRTLEQKVDTFRNELQQAPSINKVPSKKLLQNAQTIYEWFIKPMEKTLSAQNINTLVIVPDGILRTIPFAALHDGKHYLIERRYALAVTPSMKLTVQAHAFPRDNIQMLFNGLSIKPDKLVFPDGMDEMDFPELPKIKLELKYIKNALSGGNVDVLTDTDFVIASVETKLRSAPYTIVHFATHGNFDNDPNKTFLLAYNELLTMDHLRDLVSIGQFRDKPVELLTLSACQTAKGNERAALGLAGVALKAGARSAVGSLWVANDAAVAELMKEFYQHLINPKLSKAQALQKAQQKLLSDPKWSHPFYWATFLLIGNWL